MLPWSEMMRSALAAGIRPADFWRLSLKEWRWLAARGAGLKAGQLAELMAGFPDVHPTAHPGAGRDPDRGCADITRWTPACAGVSGKVKRKASYERF